MNNILKVVFKVYKKQSFKSMYTNVINQ